MYPLYPPAFQFHPAEPGPSHLHKHLLRGWPGWSWIDLEWSCEDNLRLKNALRVGCVNTLPCTCHWPSLCPSQGWGDHVVIFIKNSLNFCRVEQVGIWHLCFTISRLGTLWCFVGHSSFRVLTRPQWGCQILEDLLLAPAESPRSL